MAIRDKVKKTFKEKGIVLFREHKKATEAWTDSSGKAVAAQPERWVVGVICSENFNPVEGFVDRIMAEYRVPQKDFANFKYGTEIRAMFEMTSFGVRPFQDIDNGVIGLELLTK